MIQRMELIEMTERDETMGEITERGETMGEITERGEAMGEITERGEAMGEITERGETISTIIDAIEKMESVDSWIYGKAFSAGAEFRTVQIIRMLQDMKGEDYNEEERDA